MRIVLTGGGSGAHVYPALAIGRQLLEEERGSEILYIGSKTGAEAAIVPPAPMRFETLDIVRVGRRISFDHVRGIIRFIRGVRRSKTLLLDFKPDVVVGTGGSVSGPVVYAAAKLGIPTLLHEQNAAPGRANAALSRYADVVAVSFKDSADSFKRARRVLAAGNPCAANVLRANRNKGYASLGIPYGSVIALIYGGSRGSKAINDAMVDMAPLLQRLPNVHFVFVTGESYYDGTMARMKKVLPALSNYIHVQPYLHNMPDVLAATTIAVCRSGASALAELTALGIPAILVPSPNSANHRQIANASSLVEAGAAEMIAEWELTGAGLFSRLQALLQDGERMARMGAAALNMGEPRSAALLVSEIRKLANIRKATEMGDCHTPV
ncbi:undecaprenyldiphospho-muramoylpentapeptide beta-N-acetylglucosaminyltransferase [Paenibacillus methanolicus]|uniref:UDP-N-acetylglucosamine--N-acetylmuramyl-(pentapeptide) pyrophosphoryl-undecaprenol N-acetylglucosamine transferase n=1 Tax=Paenibacillus methanolicus TaxID=582686 RepID=A0A5S5CIX0_9BACL|nr:undecaprenyldiphospho-muramoylpentapeptide beta-N-acetylglucosaminyltransferase [Paenibacillus methanolicus]TYP77953.1 UDP-N-acetylglucosamine--N-acetylmuramyl-(pentapeptide) pyrophosphoryl-undecaprenol N-acetylglucosamine transferase [Paenibacillus methanolicus]